MDRVRQPSFVRKAGAQVPQHVLDAMARQHPNIQLLWSVRHGRWCMVQRCRGTSHLVGILGTRKRYEAPTLANTVYVLNRSHPSNFKSQGARDRLLEQMDANPAAVAAQKRAKDAVREGSSDLFNVMTNRVVVGF